MVAKPNILPAHLPQGAAESQLLDKIIHERLRLGMVSALAVNQSLSFVDRKSVV